MCALSLLLAVSHQVGAAGPFDHADRFEPLKHLMISDEHNKRMGEAKGEFVGGAQRVLHALSLTGCRGLSRAWNVQ